MSEYDKSLNDKAIRLALLEQAMIHMRQNAAALGYGANLVGESMRAERDELMSSIREAGNSLTEENIERGAAQRAKRHAGTAVA
jgi:hypothetical protein